MLVPPSRENRMYNVFVEARKFKIPDETTRVLLEEFTATKWRYPVSLVELLEVVE
ncbi:MULTISPECIES: hypothetical protein [Cuniculiplasmataceae]|uniref:hypothetical protein n=1 Tax=Cuniculiplasma sp. SKW3 TaxID=3400170 RepID=UPI003FD1C191